MFPEHIFTSKFNVFSTLLKFCLFAGKQLWHRQEYSLHSFKNHSCFRKQPRLGYCFINESLSKANMLLSSETSTFRVTPVSLTLLSVPPLFYWVVLFSGPLCTRKSDRSHHVTLSREFRSCVQMAKFTCFVTILQGVGFKF